MRPAVNRSAGRKRRQTVRVRVRVLVRWRWRGHERVRGRVRGRVSGRGSTGACAGASAAEVAGEDEGAEVSTGAGARACNAHWRWIKRVQGAPHCHGLGNIQCTRSESLNTSRAREPARALELSRALARARARATRPATLWRGRWRDYRPRLTALAPRGRGRERGRGQGRGRWQASPRFAGPPPRWPSSLPSPCAVRALALVPAHSCQ